MYVAIYLLDIHTHRTLSMLEKKSRSIHVLDKKYAINAISVNFF